MFFKLTNVMVYKCAMLFVTIFLFLFSLIPMLRYLICKIFNLCLDIYTGYFLLLVSLSYLAPNSIFQRIIPKTWSILTTTFIFFKLFWLFILCYSTGINITENFSHLQLYLKYSIIYGIVILLHINWWYPILINIMQIYVQTCSCSTGSYSNHDINWLYSNEINCDWSVNHLQSVNVWPCSLNYFLPYFPVNQRKKKE